MFNVGNAIDLCNIAQESEDNARYVAAQAVIKLNNANLELLNRVAWDMREYRRHPVTLQILTKAIFEEQKLRAIQAA